MSGGSADAVLDGRTGIVVDRPADLVVAAAALRTLLDDTQLRRRLAETGRAPSA